MSRLNHWRQSLEYRLGVVEALVALFREQIFTSGENRVVRDERLCVADSLADYGYGVVCKGFCQGFWGI
jgi:hypothetical protein